MIKKIKYLFVTSRPVSWINTAFPFAAGYYMTTGSIDWILALGSLFFLIPYNLLMYGVNDVFDYESDILNPRKGGIEGAKLAKSTHPLILASSFSFALPFVVFLLLKSTTLGKIVLLFVLFDVLAYSLPKLRFKERPFIDSLTSSIHFTGPLVYAFTFTNFSALSWLIIASFILWGMASHAFGAVQDIAPDKEAGLGSIATVLGAKRTVRIAVLLYTISGLLLGITGRYGIIIASCSLLYIANIWPYLHIEEKAAEQTNVAWKRFIKLNLITGFVITLVLIAIQLR